MARVAGGCSGARHLGLRVRDRCAVQLAGFGSAVEVGLIGDAPCLRRALCPAHLHQRVLHLHEVAPALAVRHVHALDAAAAIRLLEVDHAQRAVLHAHKGDLPNAKRFRARARVQRVPAVAPVVHHARARGKHLARGLRVVGVVVRHERLHPAARHATRRARRAARHLHKRPRPCGRGGARPARAARLAARADARARGGGPRAVVEREGGVGREQRPHVGAVRVRARDDAERGDVKVEQLLLEIPVQIMSRSGS